MKNKKRRRRQAPKFQPVQKESLIDEKCDWNGSMFPFRGTKQLEEQLEQEVSDYDDEEWTSKEVIKPSLQLNNALGALMGAYLSDDEEKNDDDPPVEEKIQREQVTYPSDEVTVVKQVKKPKVIKNKKKSEHGLSRVKFFKRRVTLLEKLLDSEIRHERNVLLQCVQYVVSNNFFEV